MNVINLQFCHSSELLHSPNLLCIVPSLQIPNFTLRNPTTPFAISFQKSFIFSNLCVVASSASVTENETKPFSVLLVCLSNICRSPVTEGVFTDLVNKKSLNLMFRIDSAVTINYHEDCDDAGKLMYSYCKKPDESEAQEFEKVLDLLEDDCGSLLETILAEKKNMYKNPKNMYRRFNLVMKL